MQKKQTNQGRAMSIPGGIFCGIFWGFMITLSAIALLAKLVDTEMLPWENIGYGIMITLMISSFISARVAVRKIKRRKLLVCIISGISYLGILMMISALFFGGKYYAVWETTLLIAGGSGLSALAVENNGRKRRQRKR